MEWFNVFGLALMTAIMIPNVLFAIGHKEEFTAKRCNKAVEIIEQIGRFGCSPAVSQVPAIEFDQATRVTNPAVGGGIMILGTIFLAIQFLRIAIRFLR